MSTALAIASVTAVLKDLLNNGLIDHNVTASLGSVAVSALPPDRINTGEVNEKSQLNLFMYQVTPNQGWRNLGLPSRDSTGERLTNPPLALDLHYMLTAYGAKDLHTEILLGYGMQLLHETPVLTRDAIRKALGPSFPVDGGGGWPSELQNLFASGLADQVEQIKIAPLSLNTEEISKLWSAFQAHYRPTAAYQASVVLIQSRRATLTPLPVRQRNIYVRPFKHPAIARLLSQESDSAPALPDQPILSNYNLVIEGRDLRSDDTLVVIGGVEREPESSKLEDKRVTVSLAQYLLSAGVQPVQVVQRIAMGSPPIPHLGISSNVSAFVLRPNILAPITVNNLATTPSGLRSATLRLQIKPAVGETQRLVLILNEFKPPTGREALTYTFAVPSRAPSSPPGGSEFVDIPITEVVPLTYIVRVQVDGAESPLRTDGFGMYAEPHVTIV